MSSRFERRGRQLAAVIRIELAQLVWSRRILPSVILAALPLILTIVLGLATDRGAPLLESPERARYAYAMLYATLILGAVLFFGCAVTFSSLFRSEILQRSIHYYLLTPVPRLILVLGKYVAGLLVTVALFGSVTIVSFGFLYLPFGASQFVADLTGVAGAQLTTYLGITVLACVGYGAVFTLTGLVFRNPIVPIGLLAGWELMHFALPPMLKALSVVHYLKGLLPIPMDDGPLAVVVAPPTVWLSLLGLLCVAAVAVGVTTFALRRLQIQYTD